jgi:hypothetical protein
MDLVLFGIIAGVAWYYTEFKKFTDEYQIKIKGFQVDFKKSAGYAFLKIICRITLQINNPSKFVATLSKLQLAAWYNNKMVGSIVKDTPTTLQAGNMNYDFEIALNTLNIFGSAAAAIEAIKNKSGLSLQLKGFGEVGKATITINETVKVL